MYRPRVTRRKVARINPNPLYLDGWGWEPCGTPCSKLAVVSRANLQPTMSHEGEEELLDYSDTEEISANKAPAEAAVTEPSVKQENGDKKGSYVGIHSTGFRDFLLKSELLRAIVDCGFEHPSEGLYNFSTASQTSICI